MTKEQQTVTTEIARLCGAGLRWNADGAVLKMRGRRVALEIAAIPKIDAPRPRLRFDRVVMRVTASLQENLREKVPAGTTVVVTLAAPIRLAAKTAAEMEGRIAVRLHSEAAAARAEGINGNQVRLGVVRHGLESATKIVVLVHNPDTESRQLVALTEFLLRQLAARPR